MHVKPPLVAFVGATATGKTALAVALAQKIDGEIINADSMQFYRGMDIGTAKATPEEQQGIPHHLLDILDLQEEANVAAFQTQARHVIKDIRRRSKVPILTGGSGLYIRAVVDTLEFPPTDAILRQTLTEHVSQHGSAQLLAELQTVDPQSAQRLTDDRRIIRAVEVYRLTGRPFSSYMPERQYHADMTPIIQIGLLMERPELHQRIAQRVHHMMQSGWIEEVQKLKELGLEQAPTASRAIGYRQMLDYLSGQLTRDEAIESTIVATRRFARRQETWFKADPRVRWIDPKAQDVVNQVLTILETS